MIAISEVQCRMTGTLCVVTKGLVALCFSFSPCSRSSYNEVDSVCCNTQFNCPEYDEQPPRNNLVALASSSVQKTSLCRQSCL